MYKQGEMHFGLKVIRKVSPYYYEVQRENGAPYTMCVSNLANHYRRITLDIPRRLVRVSPSRCREIVSAANSSTTSIAESTICMKLGWDLNNENLSEIYCAMLGNSGFVRLPNAIWYRKLPAKMPAYLYDFYQVEKTAPEGMTYPMFQQRTRKRPAWADKTRSYEDSPRLPMQTVADPIAEEKTVETAAPGEAGVPLLDLIDRRIAEQLRIATEAKAKAEALSSKGEEARKRVTIHRAKVKKVIGDLRIELGGIERKIMDKAEPRILADTLGESFSLPATGEDVMEIALDHMQKLILLSNGES